MAIPRLLAIALLLSLIPATAFAAVATHSALQPSASSTKLSSLSINVSGNATTVGDRATPSVPTTQMIPALVSDTPEAASQTFHATVTISSKVVNQNGTSGMLILIGYASTSLTTDGSTTVTFSSPQSKLTSSDFLSLKGPLTVS